MQTEVSAQLFEVLQKTFGFSEFRPGQLEAITTLMTKNHLLCIQPTGYGKSLLYQLPAVLLDGITLVISPLLALMRDQLAQLKNRFGIAAASINTDQNDEENFAARRAALAGNIRILFIAPEQLDHVDRFDFLLGLPIKLLVVDEAHCISTWGHDFRPSYRQIIKLLHALIEKNSQIKLLALTATANGKTEADIKQQLTLDKQKIAVHRESMDRPNIRLRVIEATGTTEKLAQISQLLETIEGTGLIYCATRENTELVAEYLSHQNFKATAYHAGLATEHKRRIQNDFVHDHYQVIAATNALGMGIDKSNLRFIIHFDFPGSITAYYQEVGRCGRDGQPAEGILLYDPADHKIQKYFIESAQPNIKDFECVLNTITTATTPLNLTGLKRATGLHPTRVNVITAELVEQNFLTKLSQSGIQVYQTKKKSGKPNLKRYETQLQVKNAELTAIQYYAEQTRQCLMLILRAALGDPNAKPCKKCSVCDKKLSTSIRKTDHINTATHWLNNRIVTIELNKKIKGSLPGITTLEGKQRSKEFVIFMRTRATSSNTDLGISDELMQLIKSRLKYLDKQNKLSCIIPLPSQTWGARTTIAGLLANHLQIPVLPHCLYWHEQPNARQGELLNNDQRQHNVAKRMRIRANTKIPTGTIVLFDDYIGSGSTMNEAARCLRDAKMTQEIAPFTIASVKWALGKRGMV